MKVKSSKVLNAIADTKDPDAIGLIADSMIGAGAPDGEGSTAEETYDYATSSLYTGVSLAAKAIKSGKSIYVVETSSCGAALSFFFVKDLPQIKKAMKLLPGRDAADFDDPCEECGEFPENCECE